MKKRHGREVKEKHCPVCHKGHIVDEVVHPGVIHIVLHTPEDSDKAFWFLKCPICKSQIGASPQTED